MFISEEKKQEIKKLITQLYKIDPALAQKYEDIINKFTNPNQ